MSLQLHDYQLLGRDYLRERKRAALWADMGLGKTATVLSALTDEHLPALVCAPKRVAETVWQVEKDLWRPDLTLARAVGEPAARQESLASGADIVVIGRDNLADAAAVRSKFRTVVLDEASGFKTKSSNRFRNARTLVRKPACQNVWELTGTPAPNGYLDLWGQMFLLDEGKRLGKTLGAYRGRYFIPIFDKRISSVVPIRYEPRPEAHRNIDRLIEDIVLAMGTEGRVKLPPTTFNDVRVILPAKVRRAYDKFAETMVADLRDIFGGGHLHTAKNAATLTSRLSQMTSGFIYVDEAWMHNYDFTLLHREKMAALQEIMDSPRHGGVLTFYRFQAERDMILKEFPYAVSIDEPDSIERWNRQEIPMLVAHPASAGHGLNLQHGGHTIVWTTPTWDLEHWDQGNKRLARQGQKHPVVIHVLMAKQTIDRYVRGLCDNKSEVQSDLLAFMESPI